MPAAWQRRAVWGLPPERRCQSVSTGTVALGRHCFWRTVSRRGMCTSGARWCGKKRVGEESYRNKIILRVQKTVTLPRVSSLQKLHITETHDGSNRGHYSPPRFPWKHSVMSHKEVQQVTWQMEHSPNRCRGGMECALKASVREKEGVQLLSSFLPSAHHWLALTPWEVSSPSLQGGSPSPFSGT